MSVPRYEQANSFLNQFTETQDESLLHQAFHLIDEDGDGQININTDGYLSVEEFKGITDESRFMNSDRKDDCNPHSECAGSQLADLHERSGESHDKVLSRSKSSLVTGALDMLRNAMEFKESVERGRQIIEEPKEETKVMTEIKTVGEPGGDYEPKEPIQPVVESSVVSQPQTSDMRFADTFQQYEETKNRRLLQQLFNFIDSNHDGIISKAELEASYLVRSAGLPAIIANKMMLVADANKDGVLSIEEFKELLEALPQL